MYRRRCHVIWLASVERLAVLLAVYAEGMEMNIGWVYDRGDARRVNQDALVAEEVRLRDGKTLALIAVCDGVGGMDAGEVASGMVTQALREWFYAEAIPLTLKGRLRLHGERSMVRMLHAVARECRALATRRQIILGTTVTALLVHGRHGYLFHAGDSRGYLQSGISKIRQLSTDHVQNGKLTACIGSGRFPQLQMRRLRFHAGDRIMLCSDGFYRRLSEAELIGICDAKQSLTEKMIHRRLQSAAMLLRQRGEQDNLTAVLCTELWEKGMFGRGKKL